MLAQLTLQLVLLSLSLAGSSTTDDALVTSESRPAAGPLIPVAPPASRGLLPLSTAILRAIQRLDSTRRHRLQRQIRHDVVFWAARGKRPGSVHYWDVGVPPSGMTSATMRRFLGLPSKRQQEWEARIDNGNGNNNDNEEEEELKAADAVGAVETGVNKDDEALPAVSETRSSERDKKEFWASRGKKDGGSDFWASRGKKNEDTDFWASRGKRGGLAMAFSAHRASVWPRLKSSREMFWGSPGSHGKWTE